jgi:hypothetical protein
MKQRFEKTVAILAKAYRERTLESGITCMCAVGNMVARANDYMFDPNRGWFNPKDHTSVPSYWYVLVDPSKVMPLTNEIKREAIRQAQSTGYSVDEILRVEAVFEANYRASEKAGSKDPAYDALVAVYELLADIDQIDLSVEVPAELVFVR